MQKWWLILNLALISDQAFALPSFEEVKSKDESSELVLLDRNGMRLDSLRLNPKFRKAAWLPLAQIAPLARQTLIETEDQHFFEHTGVDWFALSTSALKTLRGGQARGASTITMQLVSLIDPARKRNGKRNLKEKWDQIEAALELEKTWKKNEILEAYLNLVPLRGELVGLPAVAQFLFQKDGEALDPVDSAIIVAMLPSPNASWAKLGERACLFLNRVYEKDQTSSKSLCETAKQRTKAFEQNEALTPASVNPSLRLAQHFTHYWAQSLGAEKLKPGILKTSLDLGLQQKVHDLALESLLNISKNQVGEIAALVFDNKTAEIRAYLGNLQELSKSPDVDGIQAKRQAGSTLKPFFYGLALQNKKFDLSSSIKDEPLQIETANGSFQPENYDKEFHGWVSFSVALASSMNIPAIKVVQAIGTDEAVELLKKIPISDLKPAYIYGPSIALGTVDLSLFELTRAYERMAEQALLSENKTFPLNQMSSQKITRILSSNSARSLTFGLNSVLNTPYFTAVKTGTSKDMRDNWCVGFSDRYTVGVWVGNFSGSPMQDVSGVSGAAPLWRKIMDELNRERSSKTPDTISKIELPEAQNISEQKQETLPKITYPKDGSLLAYDLEIPENKQKVLMHASSQEAQYYWYLNDQKLSSLAEPFLWKVTRGTYDLQIRDQKGNTLDSIHFKVR